MNVFIKAHGTTIDKSFTLPEDTYLITFSKIGEVLEDSPIYYNFLKEFKTQVPEFFKQNKDRLLTTEGKLFQTRMQRALPEDRIVIRNHLPGDDLTDMYISLQPGHFGIYNLTTGTSIQDPSYTTTLQHILSNPGIYFLFACRSFETPPLIQVLLDVEQESTEFQNAFMRFDPTMLSQMNVKDKAVLQEAQKLGIKTIPGLIRFLSDKHEPPHHALARQRSHDVDDRTQRAIANEYAKIIPYYKNNPLKLRPSLQEFAEVHPYLNNPNDEIDGGRKRSRKRKKSAKRRSYK